MKKAITNEEAGSGDIAQLRNGLTTVSKKAGAIVVSDKESYEEAGRFVISINGMIKKVKDYWSEPKKRAFEAHRSISEKEREMLNPLENLRADTGRKISDYVAEQEKKRKLEQEKLNREREKKEQRERARLLRASERESKKGNVDKAEDLQDAAESYTEAYALAAPLIDKTTRVGSGTITQRKDVIVTVIDELALIKKIAAGEVPVSVVKIIPSELKRWVKLHRVEKMDGLRIEDSLLSSFRGAGK